MLRSTLVRVARPGLARACRHSVRSQLSRRLGPASGLAAAASVPARFNSTLGKIDKPTYQLTFTCKACNDRSSHLVSKQAYHNGTVLVQCPSCKNRHLIADHLGIFTDSRTTLDEILAAQGKKITKGTIDLEKLGDLEWEPEDVKQLK
ncbi:Uncharacterized protein C24H6.02c [Wickerhamiella sorbophila]|uniref:Uncharacterized protein C24H6.02c n=1 Tax=Wickerhamiella sorbophila TaxID=45607 RepID=A0A2T0FG30_9ASCO|nr:Uncharacterized protein C24H6.02c [Wickerhamiella sorbophila]PRT53953.1 Uncharacterized protein C24H6.02c [Wickerhamiella sorbophila]